MNYSIKHNKKNDTVFLALIITVALLIRLIWAFFFAEEYWGDAYHNLWIVEEYKAYGEYYDYKNRHVVWLPLYRVLLIFFNYLISFVQQGSNSLVLLPFLLQCYYVFLVTKWGIQNLNVKIKYYGISILVFWPLPIIFSGLQMPESLALVLTSILVIKLLNKLTTASLITIIVCSSCVALTRHEGTAFLIVLGFIFFVLKDYKRSISIIFGVSLGLSIWSIWNWKVLGDPFFWLTSKFAASGSGAEEIIRTNGLLVRGAESLLAILFILPFFPVLLRFFQKEKLMLVFSRLKERESPVIKVLVGNAIFLAAFFIGSFFFFHGADPKYLLVVALPCSLSIVYYLQSTNNSNPKAFLLLILILIPVYMGVFFYRSFNLSLEREMGFKIKEAVDIDKTVKIWSDFPPILLYADWDPKNTISSEQITILENYSEKAFSITETLKKERVGYLISARADRTKLFEYIPEISTGDTVIVDSITFIRIITSEPPVWIGLQKNKNLFDQTELFVKSKTRPIYLWKLEY